MQVFRAAQDHAIDQVAALFAIVVGILLDVGEGCDHIVGIHLLRSQAAGGAQGGVGQRGHDLQANVGVSRMGVAKCELTSFGMAQAGPASGIGRERHQVIPANRLIGPSQGFGHWAPHGKAAGSQDGRGTGAGYQRPTIKILPDLISPIHPTTIAGTPDGGLDFFR